MKVMRKPSILIHELNSALAPEDERELQMRSADKLEEITGVRPVGIRTPFRLRLIQWPSPGDGADYDSSLMADDDPYELLEEGEATGVVELPAEWIKDDAPYWAMDRFTGLRPSPPPCVPKFSCASLMVPSGTWLFLLTMHPHLSPSFTHPGSDELLAHISSHPTYGWPPMPILSHTH